MSWGHDELQADLANFLRETRGVMAWENMQLGPVGSPRPDVYTIGKSYARFRPIAYECKVTTSDYRSDITKGKWMDYLRFSCAVIFAAPAGLIKKSDLPDGAGLIQRSDSGWRVAKAPTLQTLDNMPRDAWLKLLMDGVRREADRVRIDQRMSYDAAYRADKAVRQRVGEDVADLVSQALRSRERVERLIETEKGMAEEIEARIRQRRQEAEEHARRRDERLNDSQRELGLVLGLRGEFDQRDVVSALRQAARRVGENQEIMRLRNQLSTISAAVQEAEKAFPGADNDNSAKDWRPPRWLSS